MIDHATVLLAQRPGHRLLARAVIEDLRGGGETLDVPDPVGQHLALAGPPDHVVAARAGRGRVGRLTFLQTFQGRPWLGAAGAL